MTLPTDGRPVYVRLWTMFNGAWVQFNNYWFTTQAGSGPAKAQMTSPTNGSTFSSTAVTFTWNAGSQAQQYALWVGSAPGAYDIYAGGEALRTSKALTIPATGKPVYVRLWTMLNGAWTDYNTYVYTAKGP